MSDRRRYDFLFVDLVDLGEALGRGDAETARQIIGDALCAAGGPPVHYFAEGVRIGQGDREMRLASMMEATSVVRRLPS